MKILVTYLSLSGKTKMVANAIFSVVLENNEAGMKKLSDTTIEELANYDLVFVGSPCHHADIVKSVKEFLEKIPAKSKFKLAGFITHSSYSREKDDGKYEAMFDKWVGLSEKSFEKISTDKELDFRGFFRCMGAATEPIEGFINNEIIPDEKEFEDYLKESRRHPDEVDLENAKTFARKIVDELK
ncbi:MAG: flavodoxin family protein [Candidatus Heimdallarchaeota archaeon]